MGRDLSSRTTNRLTARAAANLKRPGCHCDGGGLYLRISPRGTKSWLFRFAHAGRTRDMGLGPYPTLSLAAAREAALQCRQTLLRGDDPIEVRFAERAAAAAAAAPSMSFRDCGKAYLAALSPEVSSSDRQLLGIRFSTPKK